MTVCAIVNPGQEREREGTGGLSVCRFCRFCRLRLSEFLFWTPDVAAWTPTTWSHQRRLHQTVHHVLNQTVHHMVHQTVHQMVHHTVHQMVHRVLNQMVHQMVHQTVRLHHLGRQRA